MRTSGSPGVRLRLGEINRRSAELSAISLKLEEMVSQLDRLRKLTGRIELLGPRRCGPSVTRDRRASKIAGNGRDGT